MFKIPRKLILKMTPQRPPPPRASQAAGNGHSPLPIDTMQSNGALCLVRDLADLLYEPKLVLHDLLVKISCISRWYGKEKNEEFHAKFDEIVL